MPESGARSVVICFTEQTLHSLQTEDFVSAVSTPLQRIFKNALLKASHSCKITCECSESARKWRIVLYKRNHHHHPHHQDLTWDVPCTDVFNCATTTRETWTKKQALRCAMNGQTSPTTVILSPPEPRHFEL